MPLGPGKYDDACTQAREAVGLGGDIASRPGGVLLIVLGGARGSGFSCQADVGTTLQLPAVLRDVANKIERHGAL